MKIEIALERGQVDHTHGANIGGIVNLVLLHHFARPLNDAADARLSDEHMVRFFSEHEAASARQRIKTGFGQGAKLEFSVAVGEKREHVESQPVRRGLVESTQNPRIIGVSRTPLEQSLGLFASIAAEVAVQEV